MIEKIAIVFLCTAGLLACSSSTLAQSQTTGRIAGTVKDQTDALIVGAEVTVTSITTSEERKITSDSEGTFTVPLLPPGTYRVRITATGFAPRVYEPVKVSLT